MHAAKEDKELRFAKNFMTRCYPKHSPAQRDLLAEWEVILCEPAHAERLASQPALQSQLEKFALVLKRGLPVELPPRWIEQDEGEVPRAGSRDLQKGDVLRAGGS